MEANEPKEASFPTLLCLIYCIIADQRFTNKKNLSGELWKSFGSSKSMRFHKQLLIEC